MTKISEISRDSSTSFEDNEEFRVRKFAKHMLKSSLFIGSFLEKRFVEPLNSYRDVIKIADDETDLINNIKAVRKRCSKFFLKNIWIGITEPSTIGAPAGYNLWVTLDDEVFGSYWYKIRNVEFYHNEVKIKLEVVRPLVKESTPIHTITPQQILAEVSQSDIKELGSKFGEFVIEKLIKLFSETITWQNFKEAIIFIFLLASTLITFFIHTIRYLLDYILKLMHETSGIIKVCTPIIIGFMKLITNTINGLYYLIAIMWRDRAKPKIIQNSYQVFPHQVPYYNNMRALPSDSDHPTQHRNYGSSVRITPLN